MQKFRALDIKKGTIKRYFFIKEIGHWALVLSEVEVLGIGDWALGKGKNYPPCS
jgi:hypothetical protein